jgi:hypothetical protein
VLPTAIHDPGLRRHLNERDQMQTHECSLAKLSPLPNADTRPIVPSEDTEILSFRKKNDWFAIIHANSGPRHICDRQQFITTFRDGILQGKFHVATPVEVHAQGALTRVDAHRPVKMG